MKKFNVNVNGTVYSVEVEEVGGTVAAWLDGVDSPPVCVR